MVRVAIAYPLSALSSFFMANTLRDAGLSDALLLLVLGWAVLLMGLVGWIVGGAK